MSLLFVPCIDISFISGDPLGAVKATTQAAPPVAPTTPQLAAPAAANALKLMWQSPPARGAPVKGFTLEMAQEPEQEPGIGDPTVRRADSQNK